MTKTSGANSRTQTHSLSVSLSLFRTHARTLLSSYFLILLNFRYLLGWGMSVSALYESVCHFLKKLQQKSQCVYDIDELHMYIVKNEHSANFWGCKVVVIRFRFILLFEMIYNMWSVGIEQVIRRKCLHGYKCVTNACTHTHHAYSICSPYMYLVYILRSKKRAKRKIKKKSKKRENLRARSNRTN